MFQKEKKKEQRYFFSDSYLNGRTTVKLRCCPHTKQSNAAHGERKQPLTVAECKNKIRSSRLIRLRRTAIYSAEIDEFHRRPTSRSHQQKNTTNEVYFATKLFCKINSPATIPKTRIRQPENRVKMAPSSASYMLMVIPDTAHTRRVMRLATPISAALSATNCSSLANISQSRRII
jgi:hypothetical protein